MIRACARRVSGPPSPAVATWAQRHGSSDLPHTVEIFGLCRDGTRMPAAWARASQIDTAAVGEAH